MNDASPLYSLLAGTAVACPLLRVNPYTMLEKAGLSNDIERHETVGVTAEQFYRAWDALVACSSDTDVPIRLGTAMARGPFIPAMFALTCAPNLAEGLRRLVPYKALIGPSAWSLVEEDSLIRVVFEAVEPDVPMPESMAAMQAVLVLESLRSCVGSRVVPREVHLEPTPSLTAFFGIQPVPEHRTELVLRRADAERRFVSENKALWTLFQQDLDVQRARRDARVPLPQRVRAAIASQLASGPVSLADTSTDLGMSPRALQAALHEVGTTFQQLLDEVRRDLALRYLRRSTLRNDEIACLVGFRDPNSFYRAFRSWTGMTPTQARTRR